MGRLRPWVIKSWLCMPEGMCDASNGQANAPASCWQLFSVFTVLALQGFGGVIAVAQRELCDKHRWLTHTEFLTMLGTAQVLPGPNVCNLSVMVGDRFFGWRGALAALAGMIAVPMGLMLSVAWLIAQVPVGSAIHGGIRGAIWGIAAVAAGQIIGTVLKLAAPLREHPVGWQACVCIVGVTFLMMTYMKWPLLLVLLGLGPVVCLWTWTVLRQTQRTHHG
jgi:chromate transporter